MYYYPVAMITGIPIRSVNNPKHSIIKCQHRTNTVQFIIIIWLYYFTANKTVNMSCNILKPPALLRHLVVVYNPFIRLLDLKLLKQCTSLKTIIPINSSPFLLLFFDFSVIIYYSILISVSYVWFYTFKTTINHGY